MHAGMSRAAPGFGRTWRSGSADGAHPARPNAAAKAASLGSYRPRYNEPSTRAPHGYRHGCHMPVAGLQAFQTGRALAVVGAFGDLAGAIIQPLDAGLLDQKVRFPDPGVT